jgi:hypothetical protein
MTIEINGEERVSLADESERANEELKTAFYDLAAFIDKELKTLLKFMKTIDNPGKIDEKVLAKVEKSFRYRVERYAAAKDNLRKRATIVHPSVGMS